MQPGSVGQRPGGMRKSPQRDCGLLGRTEAELSMPMAHVVGAPVAYATTGPGASMAAVCARGGLSVGGPTAAR